MRTLYHYPICPFSRSIRVLLFEKQLDVSLDIENFWEKRSDFLNLNSLGEVPVLVDLNGSVVSHAHPIFEYIEETYPSNIGGNQKSEIRRLCSWIYLKIASPIVWPILMEKHFNRFFQTEADPKLLRTVKNKLTHELDYAIWLIQNRSWLASDTFSYADILLSCMLSTLDYTNDISWDNFPLLKEWYTRIKCRPSFKTILTDRVVGIIPPKHYSALDF